MIGVAAGPAVVLRDLHKRHGRTEALNGLSFSIPSGSITGLLGPNGAGKTTAIKLLLGMARPDRGDGLVFGHLIGEESSSVAIRRRTGFVSETKELYPHFDVAGMIRLTRSCYPGWRPDLADRMREEFALPPRARVSALSKGMRTKLALLLASCRGADLLVLDEPTDGLDPASIELVLAALMRVAATEGTTMLISSHQIEEIERVADRVVLVHRGRAVLEAGLDDLRGRFRRVRIITNEGSNPLPGLRSEPGVVRADQTGRVITLLVDGAAELVVERARRFAAADSVEVHPVGLREVFLGLTGPGT